MNEHGLIHPAKQGWWGCNAGWLCAVRSNGYACVVGVLGVLRLRATYGGVCEI
jgi:hypothetical protein